MDIIAIDFREGGKRVDGLKICSMMVDLLGLYIEQVCYSKTRVKPYYSKENKESGEQSGEVGKLGMWELGREVGI